MAKEVYTLSPSELRQLQLILLEMLSELDRICKKHSIRYCLIAGTLLGAVRHGGFIPWDDDLDVAMTRCEYERFRRVCETDLDTEKYFFQDDTTDEYYPWGYGRIRRKGSEFIRVGQEHLKMKTGIFLDVFPLDSVPDFSLFRGVFTAWCFFLRKILYAQTGKVSAKHPHLRLIYRILNKVPPSWAFRNLGKMHARGKSNKTKYVRILTFPTPKNRPYGYLRRWYEELSEIEFEGRMFPGIRDFDGYLTYKYGDYMTQPSETEKHWHPVVAFELPKGEQL